MISLLKIRVLIRRLYFILFVGVLLEMVINAKVNISSLHFLTAFERRGTNIAANELQQYS